MHIVRFYLLTLFGLIALPTTSWANEFIQFEGARVQVCPAVDVNESPPLADSPGCSSVSELDIDPHHQLIWVLGRINPSPLLRRSDKPIGLMMSSKAASRIFLNGQLLAENGHPGLDRSSEQPGFIDAAFYIPRENLKAGANEVALLMSGHHSLIHSSLPLLTFGTFYYIEPPYHERHDAWVAFLTFGMFVVSALFTGLLSRFGAQGAAPLSLSVAACFAAGQVLSETLRSFWNYPYPMHDIRLVLIIVCGLGAGCMLSLHALQRLNLPKTRLLLLAIISVTLVSISLVQGFDMKASMSILIPTMLSCLIALRYALQKQKEAMVYVFVFGAFTGLNLANPGDFLDVNYFLVLAVLVLILTVSQAFAFRDLMQEREVMAERRRQLEIALERANKTGEEHLMVRHSGKTERIAYKDIINLSAAGDYTVLTLTQGRELLHTASLAKMENTLPSHFLRVHRSHIVNADKIVSLTRQSSGTGELVLSNQAKVPVSRRIMPSVREALSSR